MKLRLLAAASCVLLFSCGEEEEEAPAPGSSPQEAAEAPAPVPAAAAPDARLSIVAFSHRRTVFRVNGEPVKGTVNEPTFPTVAGYPLKKGRNELLVERFVLSTEDENVAAAAVSGKTELPMTLKAEGEKNLRGEFELGGAAPPPGTGISGEWVPADKDKLLDWTVALLAALKGKDEAAVRHLFDVELKLPPAEWAFFMDAGVRDFTAVPKAKMDWVIGKSMVLVLADPSDEAARLATAKTDKAEFWIDSIPFFRDSAGDIFLKGLENNWTKLKIE